jgi:ubiquinone/menaquinone biosynthesis C-methylase UbiE
MNNDYLHSLREFELKRALPEFSRVAKVPADVRVLDIGAGTGHQAAQLQSRGYQVTAVDLPVSDYASERVYPVLDYDGSVLPLGDASIDVIFSSNVLEHVKEVHALLHECQRVLANGGVAIHILPTPAWRWWTTICHYPWLALRAVQLLGGRQRKHHHRNVQPLDDSRSAVQSQVKPWWTMLWPGRHGERGMTLTEHLYYSESWWCATFAAAGFRVESSYPAGLFYTGCMLLADRVPISWRMVIARYLGSACRVYVLTPHALG